MCVCLFGEGMCLHLRATVDGKNPANQLRLVLYPIIFTRFDRSQVVQDFFHHSILCGEKKM